MSHEPHPKTDRTTPGSTPADPPGGQTELERQRARHGLPGQPTRDPLTDDEEDEEEEEMTDRDAT